MLRETLYGLVVTDKSGEVIMIVREGPFGCQLLALVNEEVPFPSYAKLSLYHDGEKAALRNFKARTKNWCYVTDGATEVLESKFGIKCTKDNITDRLYETKYDDIKDIVSVKRMEISYI